MRERTTIYDLGGIDPTPSAVRGPQPRPAGRVEEPTVSIRAAAPAAQRSAVRSGFDFHGTLSLVLPGMGQMLRGEFALGLFFLTSLGFVGAFGWALIDSLERVTETLRVLGYPGAAVAWALCVTAGAGVLLHLANILSASPDAGPLSPHPILAGLASAFVPGWGQILNGAHRRACLFVLGAWLVAATWVLAAPIVHERLAEVRLFIPDEVLAFCSPAVRFTAPAVIWTLGVYDAVATATSRRR
jgi:hypothetical protein